MKTKLFRIILSALALLQPATVVWGQTNLANALDATNLVWTTDGTGGVGWTYEAQDPLGGDNTFDGVASAKTGHIGDKGETWIQTTVVGPGTISFWWQAFSEPNADWLEFYISSNLQARICGDAVSGPSGWQYCSFQVPAGTNALKWRYAKDSSLTGGTLDCGWVDRVSYVTSPPPPLEQALNTSGVDWSTSGSAYTNGWFAQTNITYDGQLAAQSGAVWHNQTNWLQTTVSGTTNVSFWWKVSSDTNDVLEFYINGVLAKGISGEVNWQFNNFPLSAGTNVLTWQYRRDPMGTAGSNCGWVDQVVFNTTVNRSASSTAIAASTKTTVYGQVVTFTATVTPTGTGTPSGTVMFNDGGTTLGTGTLTAGKATFSTATLTVGSHSITATYTGDGSFNGSTSLGVSVAVSQSSSTTTLTSSANPAIFGQPVSFTAKVVAVSPGSGTPDGTVTFKDGTVTLGTAALSSGQATFVSSSLSVASHTVTAVYAGNASFKTSTSTAVKQTVSKANSSTVVASSANPSSFGQPITFMATVSPTAPSIGTPTGTVQFKTNGVNWGSAVTLSGGSATSAAMSTLAIGNATVTAVYNGSTSFNTSTSLAVTQTVIKADTTTALVPSTSSAVFGQPVILTATVTGTGGGAGTGAVIFSDGAAAISTNTLSGGQARYTNSTLALGSHSFTVVYKGNSGFNPSDTTSSPLTITINQASTSTTVSSSANPSVISQPVTFTAVVNPVAPGAGTRTGTVQFSIDGSAWGSPVSLSAGKATSGAISSLALGGHIVTATYSGDANFIGSDNTASPLSQTVNKPSPAISITSSKNPSSPGDPVTWTAKLSASTYGTGTPSGSIQFKVDGANFDGPVTLSGGSASSLALATLAAGSHAIAVVYSGDDNFNTTTSANFTQTVNTSPVTPATGGDAISADTAGGLFTTLTGPAYKEAKVGAVGAGTIILKAPAGFVFDTNGVAPTVKITGGTTSAYNINKAVSGTNLPVTSVTATQITFTVTAASSGKTGTPNTMTWQNIRVSPAAGTPLASGVILKTGTSVMTGVATNTSFGFLSETAGAAAILVLQTPPSDTVDADVPFPQQPVLQIQDQFGNARTYANRNADNSSIVTAALIIGDGTLQGTLSVAAVNGLATFTDLSASKAGTTINIQFTSGTLPSVTSAQITVNGSSSGNTILSLAAARPASNNTMAVNIINNPPSILGLARQADGNMELRASGVPETTYFIQAGETLGSWSTISTNVADANGNIVFLDQDATNHTCRFYRLAKQ